MEGTSQRPQTSGPLACRRSPHPLESTREWTTGAHTTRKINSSAGMSRNAGEIRRRTEACQSLFEHCLSNPHFSELDWFENRQGEFNLWVASLKAASIGRPSLDYRVRDSLEVRELICDLLDGLSEALEGLLQIGMADCRLKS